MKHLQDGVVELGTWTRASFGGHQDLVEEAVGLSQPRRKSASWMWYRGFSPDSTTMVYVLASFNNGSRHLLLDTMPSRGSSSCLERICGGRSVTWLEGNMAPCLVHSNDAPSSCALGRPSVGEGPHSAATHLSRQQLWNKTKSVLQGRLQSPRPWPKTKLRQDVLVFATGGTFVKGLNFRRGKCQMSCQSFPLLTQATLMFWTASIWTLPGESRRMYEFFRPRRGGRTLTSPSRAVPPHALADTSVPILALRDALRSEG